MVDDEAQVGDVVRRYLELSGYRVLVARSPADALCIAENPDESIDLLLTDVVMPGMSGVELARRLIEVQPDLKVLYHSGYPDNELTREGGPGPGQGYVEKPVRPKTITQQVRKVLDAD